MLSELETFKNNGYCFKLDEPDFEPETKALNLKSKNE
jgi:hypothetical protein